MAYDVVVSSCTLTFLRLGVSFTPNRSIWEADMRVAIIGSGISGTMLALRLQQLGVETTLFIDRSPEEVRTGRLPNTVGRWHHSLEREHALGIDHWNDEAFAIRRVHFSAGAPLSVSFIADL